MIKLKYVCNIYTGNSISDSDKNKYTQKNDNTIPYISTKDIDISNHEVNYENDMFIDVTLEKFKVAPKNSILMCIEGGSAGKKIALVNRDVCFVNKLCCFNDYKGDYRFLYYYLQSDIFNEMFNLNMTGLIGGVSQKVLKNLGIIYPSVKLQKKIADYLDKKCSKIDEIIKDNNIEIDLLNEYKKAIILKIVCHGINNSEYKYINIDNIDKIPTTWKLTRLKYYISIFNGKECNKSDDTSKIPVYGSGGIFAYTDNYLYNGESILFGRKGTIDKPIIVNEKFWTVDTMFYSIPKIECNLKYIYYFMKVLNWDKYILGTALPSMTQSILGEIKIPKMTLEEQNKIVEYLDKYCAKLDEVIEYRKQIIEKLEEYKKSLIYECVTGKREV